ncbi:Thioesterase/thiol ester dehydrase-isomerase [Xylariaceae sp. FL0804]|nr:Thioesterase/thiol ester dehydrase-isomerase [Xylariaceae sp. FL0804]
MGSPPSATRGRGRARLSFDEAMSLAPLPDAEAAATGSPDGGVAALPPVKRYMSRRAGWVVGRGMTPHSSLTGRMARAQDTTYGGHVYAQAAMAASRALAETRAAASAAAPAPGTRTRIPGNGRAAHGDARQLGIHSINGLFSEAGRGDRPFIYAVTALSSNPSFPNLLVTARQPTTTISRSRSPSRSSPQSGTGVDAAGKDVVDDDDDDDDDDDFAQYHHLYHRYYYYQSPRAASAIDDPPPPPPLGPVCFSATVSFRPCPSSVAASQSQLDAAAPPPWAQESSGLAAVLAGRRHPGAWPRVPLVDIDGLVAAAGAAKAKARARAHGGFPGLELRKVDLRGWNEGRPLHERRELIFYRLTAPLPASSQQKNGADAHVCAHAFGADRNGLLMAANHAGFGRDLAQAASLSYTFVVHVDNAEAVMKAPTSGDDDGEEERGEEEAGEEEEEEAEVERDCWWLQETAFPRIAVGRGVVMTKIWSPRGVHVATMYQDGIVRRRRRPGDDKEAGSRAVM